MGINRRMIGQVQSNYQYCYHFHSGAPDPVLSNTMETTLTTWKKLGSRLTRRRRLSTTKTDFNATDEVVGQPQYSRLMTYFDLDR